MTTTVRKVDGGYVLFVPDDLAARVGLREGVPIEADEMADWLIIKEPAFVERKRAEMIARITPETLHDPHEPYVPSPELRRLLGLGDG